MLCDLGHGFLTTQIRSKRRAGFETVKFGRWLMLDKRRMATVENAQIGTIGRFS